MKRSFPLQVTGKHEDRVRDKIRREINKYVRRETMKPLPKGIGSWDFACRVGPNASMATALALKEVARAIDAVALTGATEVYVEIVTTPVARKSPEPGQSATAPTVTATPSPEA